MSGQMGGMGWGEGVVDDLTCMYLCWSAAARARAPGAPAAREQTRVFIVVCVIYIYSPRQNLRRFSTYGHWFLVVRGLRVCGGGCPLRGGWFRGVSGDRLLVSPLVSKIGA